jgi:hypothetical protein
MNPYEEEGYENTFKGDRAILQGAQANPVHLNRIIRNLFSIFGLRDDLWYIQKSPQDSGS